MTSFTFKVNNRSYTVEVEGEAPLWWVIRDHVGLTGITVAIHCGFAVNPLMIEAQLQGAVVYALQALNYGRINVRKGRVQQSKLRSMFISFRVPALPKAWVSQVFLL